MSTALSLVLYIPECIVVFSDTQRDFFSVFRFPRVRVLRVLGTLVRTVELYKAQHKWHCRSQYMPVAIGHTTTA